MQTPKIINFFLVMLLSAVLLNSCEVASTTEPKYIPNTKGFETKVEIIRFEQDFFGLDTSNIGQGLQNLKKKYPEFTPGFLGTVFRVNDSIVAARAIKGYLNYEPARHTFDTVQQLFQDLSLVQKQLNELATHFNYYNYDNWTPIQKAYTHLCEYGYDRGVGNGFIPLPLDMALGAGYPPYTMAQIPMYQQRTLTLEHLVPKAAYAIAEDIVTNMAKMKGAFMVDRMLYEGKKFYIAAILMPHTADSLIFGFGTAQMNHCNNGEMSLYEHLTENEILYSEDMKTFSKFVTPGPFNPQIGLPGNSGSWLGYRMILSYAKHNRRALKQSNPKLSDQEIDQQVLEMIIKENDPQKYLQLYKPRK